MATIYGNALGLRLRATCYNDIWKGVVFWRFQGMKCTPQVLGFSLVTCRLGFYTYFKNSIYMKRLREGALSSLIEYSNLNLMNLMLLFFFLLVTSF